MRFLGFRGANPVAYRSGGGGAKDSCVFTWPTFPVGYRGVCTGRGTHILFISGDCCRAACTYKCSCCPSGLDWQCSAGTSSAAETSRTRRASKAGYRVRNAGTRGNDGVMSKRLVHALPLLAPADRHRVSFRDLLLLPLDHVEL